MHSTAEARNAYSVRICQFLDYLADLGYVPLTYTSVILIYEFYRNQFIHTRQAPSTAIEVPHILSADELKCLYQVVDSYLLENKKWRCFSMEYQVAFRLYYRCGLRLAEACNLNEGILKIMQSKGNKDRLVYMAKDVNDLCRSCYKNISSILPSTECFFQAETQASPSVKQVWIRNSNSFGT